MGSNGRKRRTISIAEARADLADVVHDVEAGDPVTITRRGKAVAVILSAQQFARLQGKAGTFWKALTAFRESVHLEGLGLGPESFTGLRDRSGGRRVKL